MAMRGFTPRIQNGDWIRYNLAGADACIWGSTMAAKKKTARSKRKLDWTKAKTYQELKEIANKLPRTTKPEENWAILERMRQLRYGYKPGELKMDKSGFRMLTMEEFRKESEQEYEEEIRKYGPRLEPTAFFEDFT